MPAFARPLHSRLSRFARAAGLSSDGALWNFTEVGLRGVLDLTGSAAWAQSAKAALKAIRGRYKEAWVMGSSWLLRLKRSNYKELMGRKKTRGPGGHAGLDSSGKVQRL
jgi:hypothetical protein